MKQADDAVGSLKTAENALSEVKTELTSVVQDLETSRQDLEGARTEVLSGVQTLKESGQGWALIQLRRIAERLVKADNLLSRVRSWKRNLDLEKNDLETKRVEERVEAVRAEKQEVSRDLGG